MKKLLTAIKKTKSIGAAGPGNVPPSFHKSHGPFALQALLSISNSSCSNAHFSLILGVAIIKLLLGAGKSPSKVAFSYPISLTYCVIKLLEKIHFDCLYYIAEAQYLFSPFHTEFWELWRSDYLSSPNNWIGLQTTSYAILCSDTDTVVTMYYDMIWQEKLCCIC